jgi:hypothetical protein
MQHKNAAPSGVFQQSNKADFAVENKEEVSAPSGIGSELSQSVKPQKPKSKKAKEEETTEAPVVEVAPAAEEAPVAPVSEEAVVVEVVPEEQPSTEEESTDSK